MSSQVSHEPSWASARGVPFECVACLDPAASGGTHGKLDLQFHARNVTILRPGRAQAPPEDVYPFSFCYDTASTTEAIHTRTVRPYVHRVLDGFNVNCIFLGSTSSRKDVLFQGHGTSTHRAGDSSRGIVHHALTALFDTLHKRSIEMGQAVAARLRAVPSKSFDYVVETSYVYARDELIRDVYSTGSSVALVGDPLDGWTLQGAQKKPANNAAEAHQQFEAGRALCYNPAATGDNVDAHTLLAFVVTVWQFLPAVNGSEEAQVVRAQMRFIHSPGTERWAVDPALLRIREGTSLNHSLLTFSASIQELRSMGTRAQVDTGKSVLSKLLAHSFGGNVYTLVIGAFVHGEPLESEALLKHIQGATLVETFPVKNGICARGLLRNLQSRVFQLQAEQRALEEQLEGGNSHNVEFSTAKMAHIMEQNLELKEEMAAVLQEKAKVQEALDSSQNSASVHQEEMKKLLDTVVSSEENRLAMGRALIDAQLEHNTAAQVAEQKQYALEQQILELEGRLAQASAVQDGQIASDRMRREAEQQRDVLDNRFRFAQTHTEDLLKTIATLEDAKHKIEQQSQEETLQLRQRLLEQTQSLKKLETDLHTARSELQLLQHRQGNSQQERQDLEQKITTLQGIVHSDTQQTEKEFIMTQNNEVRDLKRQKQALEESLIALKQSTSSQNNKLKVLRQDYQQKLQSLVQQMLNMRAECEEASSDTWDTRVQRTLAEVNRVHQEQDRENMNKIQQLQIRCGVRKARHEDDLLGISAEQLLLEEDVEIDYDMTAQTDLHLHLDLPVGARAISSRLPQKGTADILKVGQFQGGSDLQLVRKVKNAETRALLAEEQLQQMTQYMASATQAYQQEIMRLRKLVSQDNKHSAPVQS